MGILRRLFKRTQAYVAIKEYGIYDTLRKGVTDDPSSVTGKINELEAARLSKITDRIPLIIGLTFGMKVVVHSTRDIKSVQLRKIYRYPLLGIADPKTGTVYLIQEYLGTYVVGKDYFISYTFDEIHELLPGRWRIEIWDGDNKLAEKVFLAVAPWETESRISGDNIAVRGSREGDSALAMERAPIRLRNLLTELVSEPIHPFSFISRSPCHIYFGFEMDGIYWDRLNVFRNVMHLLLEITEIFREINKTYAQPWIKQGFGGGWSYIFSPVPTEQLLDNLFLGTREVILAAISLPGFAFKYPVDVVFTQVLSTKLNIPPDMFFCISGISNEWNRVIGNIANDEKRWASSLKSNLLHSLIDFLSKFPISTHDDPQYPPDVIRAVKVGFCRLVAFTIVETQKSLLFDHRLELSEVDALWPGLLDSAGLASEQLQELTHQRSATDAINSPRESALKVLEMKLSELDITNVTDLPLESDRVCRLSKIESAIPLERVADLILDMAHDLADLEGKIHTLTVWEVFRPKALGPFHSVSVLQCILGGSMEERGDQTVHESKSLVVIRNNEDSYSIYRHELMSVQENRWM
jgi:hypothetical protein